MKLYLSRRDNLLTVGNRSICQSSGLFWGLWKSRGLHSCKKCQVKDEKLTDFFFLLLLLLALNMCRVFIYLFWFECKHLQHGQVFSTRFFFSIGFKCPVCSKFVSSDEMDLHLVMCLTKPRITYNGKKEVSWSLFLYFKP